MQDDETALKLVTQLYTYGIAFITNVPGIEKSVSAMATRIGPVKDTLYGYTWDGKLLKPAPSVRAKLIALWQSVRFRRQ